MVMFEGFKYLDFIFICVKFEELVFKLIDCCVMFVEQVFKDVKFFFGEFDEIVMVGGFICILVVFELVKCIIGKDFNQMVNFDEVVVVGVVIQGGVLVGEVKDIFLFDVMFFLLGVEIFGGVMIKMIICNIIVFIKKIEIYFMVVDGQINVEIYVFQGECEMVFDNKLFGIFCFDGIFLVFCGVFQIEVIFDIDVNGIFSVIVKDKGSGKEQFILIIGVLIFLDFEVDKMVKDVEVNVSVDKEKCEKIDFKNQVEIFVYQVEKQMGELGDKVDVDVKVKLEEKCFKFKEVIEKDDYDVMKILLEELQQEFYIVGVFVYQQEGVVVDVGVFGVDVGVGVNVGGGDVSDDVIDVEFIEIK